MKISIFIIFFSFITLSNTKAQVDSNPKPNDSDTLTIAKTVAILFYPDSLRIEELKKEKGLENFYTIADDAMWYTSKSREFLEKQEIEVIDTKKKYIKFEFINGQTTTFQTDSLEPIWGLILFDEKQQPLVTYPVEVSYDYKLYFKKE